MARNGLFADISNNNQQHMDFGHYGKHHVLLGHKVTEGLGFVDQFHHDRSVRIHGFGHCYMLHYHFGHCRENPQAQADFMWANTHGHFAKRDFLVIDTERGAANDGVAVSVLARWTNQFADRLKKISGHSVIIYSGESLLREIVSSGLRIPGDRAWIAAYGPRKPFIGGIKTWAWQYTNGVIGPEPHSFEGIGNCDGSRLNTGTFMRLFLGRKP